MVLMYRSMTEHTKVFFTSDIILTDVLIGNRLSSDST